MFVYASSFLRIFLCVMHVLAALHMLAVNGILEVFHSGYGVDVWQTADYLLAMVVGNNAFMLTDF